MPELPEVETVVQGLKPLVGATVMHTVVHNPQLRWPIPSDFTTSIQNSVIISLKRRAKYIIMQLSHDRTLIIHLGMSGALYLCTPHTALKKHEHITLTLSSSMHLRYHDVRRFGSFHLLNTPWQQHPLLCNLGPEPLEDSFNAKALKNTLKLKKRPIKAAIMDQRIVVGIGNIYASEALFASNIHPLQPAHSLSLRQYEQLVSHCKRLLTYAIKLGGTTLKDFVNPDAKPGYFQQTLHVYGREKQPCSTCNTPLECVRITQRQSTFCPHCQPLKT